MNTRIVRLLAGGAAACTLALGTLADVAGAQAVAQPPASGTPAWLRARLESRLDARTRAVVERVIDSARAAGVPSEPLVSKALEGASKKASSRQIVAAVERLAGALTTARLALGNESLTSELDAGAQAVQAGVDPSALERLRRDRKGQQLTTALSVLTELIGNGVPADAATTSVLALTKAGMADEQLVAFRREVERDIGVGAPPAAAVLLRANPALSVSGGPGGVRGSTPPKQRP
jgi:hypothetical protein